MLRHIKFIVVHCTQTSTEVEPEFIRDQMKLDGHRPMFHTMIDRFGQCMRLMGCNLIADIVCPENENCYHIAYVGGIRRGRSADTRSPIQHHSLYTKLKELKKLFPQAKIVGSDFFDGDQSKSPGFDFDSWWAFHKANSQHWVDFEENEFGEWTFVA
jgi:N-acetylmuramoyl-L-alanine amidase